MTSIYKYNGSILKVDNSIATSQNCCCGGCDCYKIDYNWNIIGCQNLTGSVLVKDFAIICYNDANANWVSATQINYGPLCSSLPGSNTILTLTCGAGLSTIVLSIDSEVASDTIQMEGNICCGSYIGEYIADTLSLNHTFSMTISKNNIGECDCAGSGYETAGGSPP